MKIQSINNKYSNQIVQSQSGKKQNFKGKIKFQSNHLKSIDKKLMSSINNFSINKINLSKFMPNLEVKAGKYTELILAKIKLTDARINSLTEAIATGVKPAKVRKADDDLKFYLSWQDVTQEMNYRKRAEKAGKEAEAKQNWWGRTFNSKYSEAYEKVMQPYYERHYRYIRISNELAELRQIVMDYETNQNMQRETLASLKREKTAYEAQITVASLSDAINRTMCAEGGINDRIAGYADVKSKIKKEFVGPLLQKDNIETVSVPAAVVLYGATGVGKTEMLRGIEEQCAERANVLHFPPETNIENFQQTMIELLISARKEYSTSGKRTIILLDEAEKYLCMTEGKAERLLSGLASDDFEILAKYGHDAKGNIDYLKSALDRMSEIPNENDSTKCATSLFITTNYPHLIDQDLMRRKGKFLPIAVAPASNEDLKEVIKHYFKLNSDILDLIKLFAKNDNFEENLNSQVRLTDKARNILLEKRNNGTLEAMNIDYELTNWPNLDKFIKLANPSDKKGAYSNVEWKYIINEAFDRYLENPSVPMYKHFCEVQADTIRDITPKRYANFKAINSMVNDKVENIDMSDEEKNFDKLIMQCQQGILDSETEKLVEKRMEEIKEEFVFLSEKKEKYVLSGGEKLQYDLYKKWLDMWEL